MNLESGTFLFIIKRSQKCFIFQDILLTSKAWDRLKQICFFSIELIADLSLSLEIYLCFYFSSVLSSFKMFFLSRPSHSHSRRSLRRSNLWNDFFSHSIGWLSADLLDENIFEARITHLFIIQSCRQCEDASLWVQRENIVCPIGNHRIRKHCVGAEVWVGCGYQPYLVASRCVFWDVERVSWLGEQRWIIIGISDL